jgi:hypothetical protein
VSPSLFFLDSGALVTSLDVYAKLDISADVRQHDIVTRVDADSDAEAAQALAIVLDPMRRVCWHVLRSRRGGASWREASGAIASPRRRLSGLLGRCATLCRERYLDARYCNDWLQVHRSWRSLRDSKLLHEQLTREVTTLGIADASALCRELLDAVGIHFLAELHGRCCAVATVFERMEVAAFHVALQRSLLGHVAAPVPITWRAPQGETLEQRATELCAILSGLAASPEEDRVAWSLVLRDDVQGLATFPAERVEATLRVAAESMPFAPYVYDALCAMHCTAGDRAERAEDWSEAARHFASAAALESSPASAAHGLARVAERAPEVAREARTRLEASTSEAGVRRREQALWMQLALRLGRGVGEKGAREAERLAARLMACDVSERHGVLSEATDALRTRKGASPADLGAPATISAMGERLLDLLPQPKGLTMGVDARRVVAHQSAFEASLPGRERCLSTPESWDREHWIFSRRDLVVKLAFAAALVFSVFGAATLTAQRAKAEARQVAFARLIGLGVPVDASARRDAAFQLLEALVPGVDDARRERVLEQLDDALATLIVQAVESGDDGMLQSILEDTRRLEQLEQLDGTQ